MGSYSGIAPYYDLLFPVDETEVVFLESCVARIAATNDSGFLDIGCATGATLASVSGRFDRLVGIDLDPALLARAAERLSPMRNGRVVLVEDNMLNLDSRFPGESFRFITCLGNTLPHLTQPGQLQSFLDSAHDHLDKGGLFVFQTLNYDRILDNGIQRLPTIERESIRFERTYSTPRADGCIDFGILLSDSALGAEVRESIPLRPIRREFLIPCLDSAGFSRVDWFGSFDGSPLEDESFLMIGVCEK